MFFASHSQIKKAPDRMEGEGPWSQLILRGATVVNGTGAPPVGPVDIVIEQNKIVAIRNVGYPGMAIKEMSRPKLKEGGKEIDCSGMHILQVFLVLFRRYGHACQ